MAVQERIIDSNSVVEFRRLKKDYAIKQGVPNVDAGLSQMNINRREKGSFRIK